MCHYDNIETTNSILKERLANIESDRDRLAAELAESKRQIEILEAAVDWKDKANEAMTHNLATVRAELAEQIVRAEDFLKEMRSAQQRWIDRGREVRALRGLLWLNHGHLGLYGDDGQMQCSKCGLDFRRDSVADIKGAFERAAMLASERAACPGVLHDAEELVKRQQAERADKEKP